MRSSSAYAAIGRTDENNTAAGVYGSAVRHKQQQWIREKFSQSGARLSNIFLFDLYQIWWDYSVIKLIYAVIFDFL